MEHLAGKAFAVFGFSSLAAALGAATSGLVTLAVGVLVAVYNYDEPASSASAEWYRVLYPIFAGIAVIIVTAVGAAVGAVLGAVVGLVGGSAWAATADDEPR